MKHIKTYRELNEGLRDKMKGKSDEEIIQSLKGASVEELGHNLLQFWSMYSERAELKNPFKSFFRFIKEVTGRDLWEETVKLYVNEYGHDYDPGLEFVIRYDETQESILQRANFPDFELYDITKELISRYKELD